MAAFVLVVPCDTAATRNIDTEAYFRLRMGISAENGNAGEVINQLQKALMLKGIILSGNTRDPRIGGRVIVEAHDRKKINPYGSGEFTLHEVSLVLEGLNITDSMGTTLASYESFSGFGSHENERRAFKEASSAIIEKVQKTDFLVRAVKTARRRDIIIQKAAVKSNEDLERHIVAQLSDFLTPLLHELQITQSEIRDVLKGLASAKIKQSTDQAATIHITSAEIEKIVNSYTAEPEDRMLELSPEDTEDRESYKDITGVIIEASHITAFARLRLQNIYTQDGRLVFGGTRNPDFNPLIYFKTRDMLLTSDFRVEVKNPLTIKAVGATDQGHIIIELQDARRMLLADKWTDGRIFSEGRIFVVTGQGG